MEPAADILAGEAELVRDYLAGSARAAQEIVGLHYRRIYNFIYQMTRQQQDAEDITQQTFVKAFKNKWGKDIVIGDVTQAAYLGPWLWKAAVEKAGSFDIDKIKKASPGIELKTAPEGYVRIHENHHLWSKTRIGLAQADGQYKLVYETKELMEPNPFPKGYQ